MGKSWNLLSQNNGIILTLRRNLTKNGMWSISSVRRLLIVNKSYHDYRDVCLPNWILLRLHKTFVKYFGISFRSCFATLSSKRHKKIRQDVKRGDNSSLPLCMDNRSVGVLSDPENDKRKQQLGINFDTIGSWNNRISMPILMKESIQTGKLIPQIPLDKIGTATLLGRREKNEDRYTVIPISSEILCFGIFDGHNGDLAAVYLEALLSSSLTFWLSRLSSVDKVLEQTFTDLNNSLTRHLSHYYLGEEEFNTGSTATVCLLQHGTSLTVGHVGDTRALLCRGGQAISLTQEHIPSNNEEKKRIQSRGAVITPNSLGVLKVNGHLSMTRCIGNVPLKSYGVTEKPDVSRIKVDHGQDAFLILVTDGVSFVLSDQEIVDIACSCTDPQEAAHRITDQALQFGSEDNATCVVIPLGAWGKYSINTSTIQYNFGRTFVPGRHS